MGRAFVNTCLIQLKKFCENNNPNIPIGKSMRKNTHNIDGCGYVTPNIFMNNVSAAKPPSIK